MEAFLGVSGSRTGIPGIPDGTYERPHSLTGAEERVLRDLKIKWPDRPATTCRVVRHNPQRIPLPILAALKTGRLTLRSDAVASHISVDTDSGLARGVVFVDRNTKREHEVLAKTVVLCASTIESLRILLNSKSAQHPTGIGHSSRRLGRYLTDHVMIFQAGPYGPLETHVNADPFDFGAQSGIHVPSFRNIPGKREQNFIRGYSLLGSVGRIEPGWFFMAIGEMLPRRDNYVDLDPGTSDAWGIPAARITCTHSDNEKAMIRDMQHSLADLARDCGLQFLGDPVQVLGYGTPSVWKVPGCEDNVTR